MTYVNLRREEWENTLGGEAMSNMIKAWLLIVAFLGGTFFVVMGSIEVRPMKPNKDIGTFSDIQRQLPEK